MKYCNVCKVNVNEKHHNCPLCGSFLQKSNKPYQHYEEKISPYVQYPEVKLEEKVDFLNTRTSKLLLLIAGVCIGLELALTRTVNWSFYVMCGVLFTILCVLMPINNKSKIYHQLLVGLPVITILCILFELRVTDFKTVWISALYILPALYLASILLTDAMLIASVKTKNSTGYFSILIYCTAFACLLSVILWLIPGAKEKNTVLSTVTFFAALLNFGVISTCSFKTLKEEYERKWNV